MQMKEILEQSKDNDASIKSQLYEKEQEIAILTQGNSSNTDAIAALSDQVIRLVKEIEILKKEKTAVRYTKISVSLLVANKNFNLLCSVSYRLFIQPTASSLPEVPEQIPHVCSQIYLPKYILDPYFVFELRLIFHPFLHL